MHKKIDFVQVYYRLVEQEIEMENPHFFNNRIEKAKKKRMEENLHLAVELGITEKTSCHFIVNRVAVRALRIVLIDSEGGKIVVG